MKSATFVLLLWMLPLLGQDHPGKAAYTKYCSQCHGENGDGKGYAYAHVLPKPRDFTTGVFKFRSTGNEYMPLEKDLQRVVHNGIHGTSMPSFAHIGDETINQIIDYIKVFYEDARKRAEEDGLWPPKEVPIGKPPQVNAALLEQGRALYVANGCLDCHGYEGRADGPSSPTLKDDYGIPIRPANLTAGWRFRGGHGIGDIYRAFSTGLSGTPMPSYQDSLTEEQRWTIAAYVQSLSSDSAPVASPQVVAAAVKGDLPEDFDDVLWDQAKEAYFPLTAQIIWEPVNIDPTIHGVHIKALHNGDEIAMMLRWDDPSFSLEGQAGAAAETEEADDFWGDEEEAAPAAEADDFWGEEEGTAETVEPVAVVNDSFAVQFPTGVPKGNERPYFVMGDSAYGVNLWHWTNDPAVASVDPPDSLDDVGKRYFKEFAGSAAIANQQARGRENVADFSGAEAIAGKVRYRNGSYCLIMKRKLLPAAAADADADEPTSDGEVQMRAGSFVPVAFWAWDGSNGESGAKGSLSAWYFLILEQPVDSSVYYKTGIAVVIMLLLQLLAIRSAKRKRAAADNPVAAEPAEAS